MSWFVLTSICADCVSQLCHGVGGPLWPVWVVILEAPWVLPVHRGHWALPLQHCHPHHHGDVLPVEPHSCGQWKQLLICVERLLAVFLHCPSLGQGNSVPVTWSVRPRKVAGFSTVWLRSLSHMLGSCSLEGLSPNGLLPFKVARFWQRWSRKLLFQSLWMIF